MPSSPTPENRVQGIGFGALTDELLAHEYPATTTELIDAYGDYDLTFPDGAHSLADVLAPLLDSEDGGIARLSHDSASDVQQTVLNAVGQEAVGRVGYTDREPSTWQEEEYRGKESF